MQVLLDEAAKLLSAEEECRNFWRNVDDTTETMRMGEAARLHRAVTCAETTMQHVIDAFGKPHERLVNNWSFLESGETGILKSDAVDP